MSWPSSEIAATERPAAATQAILLARPARAPIQSTAKTTNNPPWTILSKWGILSQLDSCSCFTGSQSAGVQHMARITIVQSMASERRIRIMNTREFGGIGSSLAWGVPRASHGNGMGT